MHSHQGQDTSTFLAAGETGAQGRVKSISRCCSNTSYRFLKINVKPLRYPNKEGEPGGHSHTGFPATPAAHTSPKRFTRLPLLHQAVRKKGELHPARISQLLCILFSFRHSLGLWKAALEGCVASTFSVSIFVASIFTAEVIGCKAILP